MEESLFIKLVVPFSATSGLILFSLVAWFYIIPLSKKIKLETLLLPLVLAHGCRYLGVMFSLEGVSSARLPDIFTLPATWGDVLTAFLALVAAIALKMKMKQALLLVWLMNIVGLTHFVADFIIGPMHIVHPGDLGVAFLLVTFMAPALIVSHFVMFYLLVTQSKMEERKLLWNPV